MPFHPWPGVGKRCVLASKSSNSIGLTRDKKKPRAIDARGYKLLPQPEALSILDGVFGGGALRR
jgi:hypothetical protein